MNKTTKKEAIKTIAEAKKINKIFLSLKAENELIKKFLINNQGARNSAFFMLIFFIHIKILYIY